MSVVHVNQPDFDVSFITAKDGLKSFKNNVLAIDLRSTVTEMINQWQVVFVPRDSTDSFDTLYDIIEPMAYCEIKIRSFSKDAVVVMRGFVTNVSKALDLSSGVPQRQIVISGENYGKILRMAYIHYAYGLDPLAVVGASGTGAPLFFGYGVDVITAQDGRPSTVMTQIFNNLILPNFRNIQAYLANRTKVTEQLTSEDVDFVGVRANPGEVAASKIGAFKLDIDDDGVDGNRNLDLNLAYIDPAAGAQELSVLEFIENFSGAPWNEIYTDDAPQATYLVFRPKPWRNRFGVYVGATSFGSAGLREVPDDRAKEDVPRKIEPEEVVAYQLGRTDEEVYNYFFTDPVVSFYGVNFESVVRSLPDNDNPHYTAGILNFTDSNTGNINTKSSDKLEFSRIELFGFRKARVSSRFLSFPPGSNWKDKFGGDKINSDTVVGDVVQQSRTLNKVLVNAMEHNSQLENGVITIKGREDIRAGMYVKLRPDRNDDTYHLYYVTSAQHTLGVFRNYITILTVARGEAHLDYTMKNQRNAL
jgi:hypothetical protein